MAFRRIIQSLCKNSSSRIFLALLCVFTAFANLIIFFILQTRAHQRPESLFEPVFSIHVHKNITVYNQRDPQLMKRQFGHLQTYLQNSAANKERIKPRQIAEGDKKNTYIKSTLKLKNANGDKKTTKKSSDWIGLQRLQTSPRNMRTTKLSTKYPGECNTWCHRGNGLKPPYTLAAVLLVRIYRRDLAGLSSREMFQWLQYLRYAGFQHVYVYDAYVMKNESQRDFLKPLIKSGYVTYTDWSVHNPYTIQGTQVAAYQHCLNNYGKLSKWQAAIDIDEYPFSPIDLEENFLGRFIEKYAKEHADVVEVTMMNYLFLGKPLNDQTNPLLMDRIRRRTHQPANPLVKPIYQPLRIGSAQVHHNNVRHGMSRDSDPKLLRMNHYWGARLQNWGEDTPKVLKMTEADFSIRPIVDAINRCSRCLGQDALFAKRWN